MPFSIVGEIFDLPIFDVWTDSGVKSNASFDNINAIKDYSWRDTVLNKDNSTIITVCFEMSNEISISSSIMVLEIDFLQEQAEVRE